MEFKPVDESQMMAILDTIYVKTLHGIPKVSKSVDELALDYLSKNPDIRKAARSLIGNQIVKCGTSGFLTSLGGLITLPIAVPANVSSVFYVQMRMVAAISKMGGFNPNSDQVQTLVYACLTGTAVSDVLKGTGIKFGEKLAVSAINKIPGKALTQINQRVGFRLVTKFGEKGLINFGKMVPVVGGFVGGGIDVTSTKIIGENAYRLFIR